MVNLRPVNVPGLRFGLDPARLDWTPTQVEGVGWIPLHLGEGDPAAPAGVKPGGAVLIRMDPGCGYPSHRHVGVEEVLILAGGYRDEEGVHSEGDYVRYPAGSAHAPIALGDPTQPIGPDNPACVMFATAREGIEILA